MAKRKVKLLVKLLKIHLIETTFLVIRIFGIFICLTRPHWFGVWFGLELNLIAFIPVIAGQRTTLEIESCVKYFLAQGVGSGLLMLGGVGIWITGATFRVSGPVNCNYFWAVIVIGLLLKLGVAPFHFWVPGTMANISWVACLLLRTIQKIGPLFCFRYFLTNKWVLVWIGGIRAIVGGVGGCFQNRLRPLLAYSSISHIGWCVGAITERAICGGYYFMWYLVRVFGIFILLLEVGAHNISSLFGALSVRKWVLLSFILLSLRGLPPFVVFFGKVSTLIAIVQVYPGAATLYIIGSLVRLYFYLKLIFLSWLVGVNKNKWLTNDGKISNFRVPCFLGLCLLSGFVAIW